MREIQMSNRIRRSPRRGLAAGFTLLELLVTVGIVAAVGGLVISKVDWAKRSADSATSVAGIAGAHENIQMFRVVKGVYPDRFDSMFAAPAVAGTQPDTRYAKLWAHATPTYEITTIAPPPPGAPTGHIFSLQHAGMTTVLDHSATAAFPADSGSVARTLDYTVATAMLTVVANSAIERTIYPTGKPSDVVLVALGIGSGCTANGITMSSTPVCSAVDPAVYYPRFQAIFATYANGKRAELKAVVDSAGQTANRQLRNFYENTPQ